MARVRVLDRLTRPPRRAGWGRPADSSAPEDSRERGRHLDDEAVLAWAVTDPVGDRARMIGNPGKCIRALWNPLTLTGQRGHSFGNGGQTVSAARAKSTACLVGHSSRYRTASVPSHVGRRRDRRVRCAPHGLPHDRGAPDRWPRPAARNRRCRRSPPQDRVDARRCRPPVAPTPPRANAAPWRTLRPMPL
jgi:hypothetical protein